MIDMEKRLEAKLTAQALVISEILSTLDRAGLLDAQAVVDRLDEFNAPPKFSGLDPDETREVAAEVDGWADMIYTSYIEDKEILPSRSNL